MNPTAETSPSMTTTASRLGAITRAEAYIDEGRFETDLARRVAIRTASQALPESRAELERYVTGELIPSFAAMGFACQTFANPVAGQGPVLLASRIEAEPLPIEARLADAVAPGRFNRSALRRRRYPRADFPAGPTQ